MKQLVASLNNSKLLMGLAMLLLNVGTKYIEIGLSRTQEQALRNASSIILLSGSAVGCSPPARGSQLQRVTAYMH